MRISRRYVVAIGVLLLLGVFALLARWYETTRPQPGEIAASTTEVRVTNGSDRGPGSLREALFIAAAAGDKPTILIRVSKITLESALPPLVNPHGLSIAAQESGAEIDARALQGGPVLDVAGEDISITGLTIRNCPGAALLVRAARFRLTTATIESCDVGVDVAENARDLALERNRFTKNRIGVRFAASTPNAVLVRNEFSAHADAGVWAVRSEPDLRKAAISVHDNRFSDDRLGVIAGNVSILVERNNLSAAREAAVHLIGAGAVVSGNRVSGGAAMGIVAENARGAVIEKNELDRIAAYGVMVRGSANTLVRANRIHSCGYGLAFVLGDESSPSTAVDNSIIEPKYNGIDVIGDSPILRRNRVLQATAAALHVEDFQRPDGQKVRANPFREGNSFDVDSTAVAVDDAKRLNANVTPVAPQ